MFARRITSSIKSNWACRGWPEGFLASISLDLEIEQTKELEEELP